MALVHFVTFIAIGNFRFSHRWSVKVRIIGCPRLPSSCQPSGQHIAAASNWTTSFAHGQKEGTSGKKVVVLTSCHFALQYRLRLLLEATWPILSCVSVRLGILSIFSRQLQWKMWIRQKLRGISMGVKELCQIASPQLHPQDLGLKRLCCRAVKGFTIQNHPTQTQPCTFLKVRGGERCSCDYAAMMRSFSTTCFKWHIKDRKFAVWTSIKTANQLANPVPAMSLNFCLIILSFDFLSSPPPTKPKKTTRVSRHFYFCFECFCPFFPSKKIRTKTKHLLAHNIHGIFTYTFTININQT